MLLDKLFRMSTFFGLVVLSVITVKEIYVVTKIKGIKEKYKLLVYGSLLVLVPLLLKTLIIAFEFI